MTRQDRLKEVITTSASVIRRAQEVRLAAETLQSCLTIFLTEAEAEGQQQDIERQLRNDKGAWDSLTTACERWLNFRNPPEEPAHLAMTHFLPIGTQDVHKGTPTTPNNPNNPEWNPM